MNTKRFAPGVVRGLLACLGLVMVTAPAAAADKATLEQGKYLVIVTGCNDCHTPGYMEAEGQTPESRWLIGDSFGWRGPWGTTYPSNLRSLVQTLTEDQWMTLTANLKARPPMPWFNLRQMKQADRRAIYHYIRHLGPGGGAIPAYVPPDQEPVPPYALFPAPPA